jgi:phosphoribosylformylglycinamidine synthase
MLPGALLHNDHHKFNCKNVFIKAENNTTLITSGVDTSKALKIPVAHGEGRYFADAEVLAQMNANGQILFRYCNENGAVDAASNPNGALENIAGVCNAGKNVFGMMPHPERAADAVLGNEDGRLLFESILAMVKA